MHSERLYSARSRARQQPEPAPGAPACPLCGQPMKLRMARKGPHTGQPFWGCTAFPDCKGIRPTGPTGPTGPTD